jgi:predicted alpha/beta-fold hydrolase
MTVTHPFQPHPVFRGGHLQTLAGFYWPTPLPVYRAKVDLLTVSDDDKIAIHDDCPPEWQNSGHVALVVHGLAGCHGSGYMVRLADLLVRNGIRCFRLDMRGSGAAARLATQPAHAGRSDDVTTAIEFVADRCPEAPLTLVGFSLGGNIALGTAAQASQQAIGNLTGCIAVSPPVDLARCCQELRQGVRRLYDRFLLRFMLQMWEDNGGTIPPRRPRSIYEFDDLITAPMSGYRDAEDYYAQCSSGPRLAEITIPTKILAARDDPMVSFAAIETAPRSPQVELVATDSGGHLGYVSTRRHVDQGRWMDWQLCEWIRRLK